MEQEELTQEQIKMLEHLEQVAEQTQRYIDEREYNTELLMRLDPLQTLEFRRLYIKASDTTKKHAYTEDEWRMIFFITNILDESDTKDTRCGSCRQKQLKRLKQLHELHFQ